MKSSKFFIMGLLFVLLISFCIFSGVSAKYVNTFSEETLDLNILAKFFVNFNANGGELVSPEKDNDIWSSVTSASAVKVIETGKEYGEMPDTPLRTGYTFMGWGLPVLPDGFEMLDYISTDSGSSFNTAISINSLTNPVLECEFRMDQAGDLDWFGTTNNSSNTILWNFSTPSTTYFRWGTTGSVAPAYKNGANASVFDFREDFHKLKIDGSNFTGECPVYVDDINVACFPASTGRSLVNAGTIMIGQGRNTPACSWRRYTIYNEGICLIDLIPVKETATGNTGFYDTVNQKMITKSGSGKITAGPVIPNNQTFLLCNENTLADRECDHELFAAWKANHYNVFLDVNDLTGSTKAYGFGNNKAVSVVYDSDYSPIPVIARNGYSFVNWKDEKGKTYDRSDTVQITGDTTFSAVWVPNEYKLTFESISGSEISFKSKNIIFDSPYGELPTATKPGFSFKGWVEGFPPQYKDVDYITLSTGQWIDTGIAVNSLVDPTVDCEFKMDQTGDMDWFGTASNSPETILWNMSPPSTKYIRWGTTASTNITYKGKYNDAVFNFTGGFHKLKIDGSDFSEDCPIYVDDEYVGFFPKASRKLTNTGSLMIGRGRTTPQSSWKHFTVYSGPECIGDFRACYNTETNEYGFYDKISGKFHGNAGSGKISGQLSQSELVHITPESVLQDSGDHAVYADFEPNMYNVMLYANDSFGSSRAIGWGEDHNIQVLYGTSFAELPVLMRTGYKFMGWFDSHGRQYNNSDEVNILNDIDLFAQWQPMSYTAKFKTDEDTEISFDLKDIYFDQQIGELPIATKAGFDFKGWALSTADGYESIEYLEVKDTQFINTGIAVNKLTKPVIDCEFKMLTDGDVDWFGTADVNSETIMWDTKFSEKTNFIRWGTKSEYNNIKYIDGYNFNVFKFTDDFHCLRLGNSNSDITMSSDILVDGTRVAYFPDDSSRKLINGGTLQIGSCRSSDTGPSQWKHFAVYDGLKCLIDLYPCVEKSSGRIGMFDRVNGIFLANSGTGNFIAGPAIENPSEGKMIDETEVLSYPYDMILYPVFTVSETKEEP